MQKYISSQNFKDEWGIKPLIECWLLKDDARILTIISEIKNKIDFNKFNYYSSLFALKSLLEFKNDVGFEIEFIDDFKDLIENNLKASNEKRRIYGYFDIFNQDILIRSFLMILSILIK